MHSTIGESYNKKVTDKISVSNFFIYFRVLLVFDRQKPE
ncbi:hypothetical protein AB996_0264 [Lactococcus cremoris]|uniref:Uncharacterized protein n=1 Tax=Lactococcus lactis subsp. cremoris TaxID=1359 RepID=A0A166KGY0_LACLC|nr:hypothetical protein AB996_0264 [Lactococcus cremoris]